MKLPGLLPVVAALLLSGIAVAQAAKINAIDSAKSEIKFAGKQMGVAAEGRFKQFNVAIQLDTEKLPASRILVTIDTNSIDTGARESDDEVKSRAWFDVKDYPFAKFVLTELKALNANKYEAKGQLTVKGKSREVIVPFSVKAIGSGSILEGIFSIKRLQFGLGEGPWADTDTVSDDVEVRFHFESAGGAQR